MSSLAIPIPLFVACGAAAAVAAALVGCQKAEPAKPREPKVDFGWNEQSLGGVGSTVAGPVAVKAGTPPLYYWSDVAETVRVVDETGGRVLAEIDARPRTIVRVDANTGVGAGQLTLAPGPLPADHRYAIYVVPRGESVSRTGSFQPRPANRMPPREPARSAE